MRLHRGMVAAVCVSVLAVSACGSSSQTKKPSPTPTPSPTTAPTPSPTPVPTDAANFYLRWWTTSSLDPLEAFSTAPMVISAGKLMTITWPDEADTYPLYVSPMSQTVSEAGIATIEEEARNDGLLGTTTHFTCQHDPKAQPITGSSVSHLVLNIDNQDYEMSADCAYEQPSPNAHPQPGTWAAYEKFENLISDPKAWLGGALGPKVAYVPDGLAVYAYPLSDSEDVPDDSVDWPLQPFASFGSDYAGDGSRCGMVNGDDARSLLAVVKPLTQDAIFVDQNGSPRHVMVRALLPGEPDLCGN